MTSDRKEAFRQWTAITISAFALMFTFLRGPLSVTFRATVEDVLRQELARHDTSAASEARLHKPQDPANEVLVRLEQDLAAIRAQAATIQPTDNKLLLEISKGLSAMESKLDRLTQEVQMERKLQGGHDRP